MWSAGSEAFDVYVGNLEVGLGRGGKRLSWNAHANLEAGLDAAFKQAFAEHPVRWGRKVPVRVWLSGALARAFLCGPVGGLKRWQEVEAVAQSMATEATGMAPPCVVQVEEWPSPHAALAVTIGEQTAEAVQTAARNHGIAVRSLRPWWAAAMDHVLAADHEARLVAVEDGDALTLLGGPAGRFETATGYVPRPSDEQTQKLLARMALTAGVALTGVVQARLVRDREATVEGLPFGVIARGTA